MYLLPLLLGYMCDDNNKVTRAAVITKTTWSIYIRGGHLCDLEVGGDTVQMSDHSA